MIKWKDGKAQIGDFSLRVYALYKGSLKKERYSDRWILVIRHNRFYGQFESAEAAQQAAFEALKKIVTEPYRELTNQTR